MADRMGYLGDRCRPMTQKRYPLTLLLDGRSVHMLWTFDKDGFNDHVFANDGRVVSFADLESLRRYAREQEPLLDPTTRATLISMLRPNGCEAAACPMS
jgi:hypothetical protein